MSIRNLSFSKYIRFRSILDLDLSIAYSSDCTSYYWCIPRRYRYKPKWAFHQKKDTNQQLALGNFDAFYKPHYGNDWPSIRISLLSLPKYCAVINKYGKESQTKLLKKFSLINFTENARLLNEMKTQEMPDSKYARNLAPEPLTNSEPVTENLTLESEVVDYDESVHKDNLNIFVPTQQVYTEKEQMLKEEMKLNSFQASDIGIKVLAPEAVNISADIEALIFPSGNISLFPHPKSKFGMYGFYLMDAASVLPVVALDVQPTDHVLDLCAAPGGKTFVMLQSLDLFHGGKLLCNDSSQSRINRLKDVLRSHFPPDIVDQVTVTNFDGLQTFTPVYNKVLVDVPCNGDRYVLTEEDNNLFQISRTHERLKLMKTQKQLLISAIKSCAVGGNIVYSTCTLSPAQNDGVIQAVMEELWQMSHIEVAVVDLTPMTELFQETFKFHDKTRYGKQVLPNLLNNFGPTYFAKLKRIK
ncbi:5-methylcytosine rRNA methyltransferase NSUN4 [Biomphalaria glabrata]|nr:5-methylcytosine rRNA methyltransferase NSUN4-like [Biomphalaria glabrata]KAI8791761.1 5-methylcytosine rRNA methyltransferase NSUN4 [Biomphalaria glabrata]